MPLKGAAKKKAQKDDPQNNAETRDLSPEAQRRRAETSRLRVQTSLLIDRLQKHAMGKLDLTPNQTLAIQILLRKTLPDLVGVKAELDVSPVVFNFHIGRQPPKE